MYTEYSQVFCEAILKLSENPEALKNLECYLSSHFEEWMKKYANTPERIAFELKCFSEVFADEN